jgi:hypothetical protein
MMKWKQLLADKENDGRPFDRGPTIYGPSNLVLPSQLTMLNLYEDFRENIKDYFCDEGIAYHELVGHIVSSQAFCLNLFGGGIRQKDFVLPIIRTLPCNSDKAEITVDHIDFEWNDYNIVYNMFGEKTGRRGEKQTSCDLAIRYKANKIPCLLLVEFKFTEGSNPQYKSLGCCFTAKDKTMKYSECNKRKKIWANPEMCALEQSKRKPQFYWSILKEKNGGPFDIRFLSNEGSCPFQYEGYQLMRSQLMGWLYENQGNVSRYDFMLLFDGRNEVLKRDNPIQVGNHALSFSDWASIVNDDRFHWRTVQDIWKDLYPDDKHRKYVEERYLSWD